MWISIFKTMVLLSIICLVSCHQHTQVHPLAAAQINFEQKDYSRSFQELLPLAERGDPKAQYALGYLYFYGLGIAKDQDIARAWFKKSASHCYCPAIFALKNITQAQAIQYLPLEYPYPCDYRHPHHG